MPARSANSQSVEIEIVRFADLIMNAGLFDEGIEAPVRALIVRAVVPLLLDESTVQTFTASVGAISVPLRQLIRGCVVDERVNGSFTVRPLAFGYLVQRSYGCCLPKMCKLTVGFAVTRRRLRSDSRVGGGPGTSYGRGFTSLSPRRVVSVCASSAVAGAVGEPNEE